MTLASELKERVRIEQQSTTTDEFGGQSIGWSELATVFAAVEPVQNTVREREVAGQVSAIAGYRVRIRLRGDVDASMRLIWKGHTLGIHSLHETPTTLELLTYEENL